MLKGNLKITFAFENIYLTACLYENIQFTLNLSKKRLFVIYMQHSTPSSSFNPSSTYVLIHSLVCSFIHYFISF